jgi:hypothetical protein
LLQQPRRRPCSTATQQPGDRGCSSRELTDGTVEQATPEVREKARAFMHQPLERDWPGYIGRLIAGGQISTA